MENKPRIGYLEKLSEFPLKTKVIPLSLDKLSENKSSPKRFIQISINNEPYIRVGELYHRKILEKTLEEFSLEYDTIVSNSKNKVPAPKGKNYELVGAGRIKVEGNSFNLYEKSSEYGLVTDRMALVELSKDVPMRFFESIEYVFPSFLLKLS